MENIHIKMHDFYHMVMKYGIWDFEKDQQDLSNLLASSITYSNHKTYIVFGLNQ